MKSPDFLMNRRHCLQRAGLVSGAVGAGTLGNLLVPASTAYAADYRALVCIFLYGGNDSMNMVVPKDTARYSQYNAIRKGLALPQASLIGLSGSDYGLHPAMSALAPIWSEGRLAPVFNVGPLHAPLTKATYRAATGGSDLIPDNLFSHSDQQTLWESGTSISQTRTGWGGRASETLGTANPVISVGGNGRYGVSSTSTPLVLPGPGATFGTVELGNESWRLQYAPLLSRATSLRAIYNQPQDSELGEAYAKMQREAFAMSERLGPLVSTKPGDSGSAAGIDAAFASVMSGSSFKSALAGQLYQVAKLIAGNATVQGNRQIFFAQQGGFDTHSEQISGDSVSGTHAGLLKTVADALACFYNATKNLGMGEAVTAFTQSDFGRTFAPNNSRGTDHAWGGHHLVIGGAVQGGKTYGQYPELVLGGKDDVGVQSWEMQGRWIPSTSVDQYAATMLSWFGASEAQVDQVLPNLRNFGSSRQLAFLK